jgi:hypothetical protein
MHNTRSFDDALPGVRGRHREILREFDKDRRAGPLEGSGLWRGVSARRHAQPDEPNRIDAASVPS